MLVLDAYQRHVTRIWMHSARIQRVPTLTEEREAKDEGCRRLLDKSTDLWVNRSSSSGIMVRTPRNCRQTPGQTGGEGPWRKVS